MKKIKTHFRGLSVDALLFDQWDEYKNFIKDNTGYRTIVFKEDNYLITNMLDKEFDYEHFCNCPMCGKEHSLKLFERDLDSFEDPDRTEHIQDIFIYLSQEEREKVKSGYCSDCQKILFARPF